MAHPFSSLRWPVVLGAALIFPSLSVAAPGAEFATTKEGIVGSYRKTVPEDDFMTSKSRDEKNKPRVAARQKDLLGERIRWAARRVTSNPISERRTGVQVGNLERVGSLNPGKPIRATAKRRGPAAVGSSR